MKIAFDCSLVPGQRGGIGQYSYNLARALSRIDRRNEYTLYILMTARRAKAAAGQETGLPDGGNFRVVWKTIPFPFQLFRYAKLPGTGFREYMLGDLDVDVVHSNTFCVPRFRDKKKKVVVTVYDASVATHPECHRRGNIAHCLGGIKDAVKYADAIIAISEHTKADLVRLFDAPPELITVTQLAAGSEYHPVRDAGLLKAARDKYDLPESYILFVGSLEPRKNVKTLLKAYAMMRKAFREEFPLVIAGGKGWMNSEIPGMVEELGIEGSVTFAGYIDSADIAAVYSGASVFVYPSLYEGFGLPILEAMSCGTPVITSNVSSMPEVAGDAAELVTPTDAQGLASALEGMLGDPGRRAEMGRRGMERAAAFSWERCARETLEVYRKVVENR
ncbi:MAG: glycosyltransferase family 4 protein [Thermodesulfobacteriota bacterium]